MILELLIPRGLRRRFSELLQSKSLRDSCGGAGVRERARTGLGNVPPGAESDRRFMGYDNTCVNSIVCETL